MTDFGSIIIVVGVLALTAAIGISAFRFAPGQNARPRRNP